MGNERTRADPANDTTISPSTREVEQALLRACQQVSYAVDYQRLGAVAPFVHSDSAGFALTEVLIVDEADRLNTLSTFS